MNSKSDLKQNISKGQEVKVDSPQYNFGTENSKSKDVPRYFVLNMSKNCQNFSSGLFYLFWLIVLVGTHLFNVFTYKTYLRTHCFLTNVNILVTIFYLLLALNHLCYSTQDTTSVIFKWLRVTYILSMTMSLVVVIFYWGAVARTAIPNYPTTCPNLAFCYYYTVVSHALILIPAWGPLLFSWVVINCSDIYIPVVFITVYFGAILFPYTKLVEPLYSVLTFSDTTSYIYLLAAFGLVVFSFLVCYGIYVCRRKKFRRIFGENKE